MKTSRFLTYILLSVIVFSSCQKEVPDINAMTGNFRAKINGTQWIATASASATMNSGIITLTGIGNRKALTIVLMGTAAGTYILNDTTFNNAAFTDTTNSGGAAFSTNQGGATVAGGQVIITKIDNAAKTISGNFTFKTFRSADSSKANFTEGIFENIKFTSQVVSPPPTNPTDTLTAMIGINPFSATAVTALPSGSNITIGGIGAGSKTVGLILPSNITPGSYTIGPVGSTITGSYINGTSVSMSISGALTVIEHNTTTKRLRANFNFIGADVTTSGTTLITQGYLSVVHN